MSVKPIPKGFHTITPHLVCRNAANAIDFYQKAFGAESERIHKTPDGKVMHAELRIGDSPIMLGEEAPDWGVLSPQSVGNTSTVIHLFVEDVDSLYKRAVSAGCTATMPVQDQFWGDRYGQLVDPFGHKWSIATHKEDLSDQEIQKRGAAAFAEMAKKKGH